MHKALATDLINRTTKDGGLTYDFKTSSFLEPKDVWYFPKYPALTKIINLDDLAVELAGFIDNNRIHLTESNTVFGTWINPETNKVYLDINTYETDEHSALRKAKEYSLRDGREIVSMYNPIQEKTVYIQH